MNSFRSTTGEMVSTNKLLEKRRRNPIFQIKFLTNRRKKNKIAIQIEYNNRVCSYSYSIHPPECMNVEKHKSRF